MVDAVSLLTFAAVLVILFHGRILRSDTWRAVATPLASIIGSGFLVSVPILRDLVGAYAVYAILALLVLAYLIGAAVRENITHVEPLLGNHQAGGGMVVVERTSQVVLAFAYFVSVAYYLVLFASFLLKPVGLDEPFPVKLLVTSLLAGIGIVGFWRGFRAVEGLEVFAVSAKLAVIAGLIAGLTLFDLAGSSGADGGFPSVAGHVSAGDLPVLLGLLIMVQGFETSRFLGEAYSAELRVRTMKLAQLLAAAIYVGFFVLMTPLLGVAAGGDGVAAIVDMLGPVALTLPFLVLLGALASQSSAAIADALGGGGLLHALSFERIALRQTYPLIAFVAALVTWATNVYSLITLASRFFALYYALQCAVAAMSAARRGRAAPSAGFAILALVCACVVVFGTPAEGG